jgi:hypothetical protein
MKLSADSISHRRDNLRAFSFAFTALDAFLRDFFKQHKQALLQHRKVGLSPAVQKDAKAIEERREQQGRTKDDYPIAYKFALSVSYLGFQNLDQTVDEFGEPTRTHRMPSRTALTLTRLQLGLEPSIVRIRFFYCRAESLDLRIPSVKRCRQSCTIRLRLTESGPSKKQHFPIR